MLDGSALDLVASLSDSIAAPEVDVSGREDLYNLARWAGVHVSIAAGRWQREHSDYRNFSKLIERNTLRDSIALWMFESE